MTNKKKHDAIRVLHITSGDLWAGAEAMMLTLAKAQQRSAQTQPEIIVFNAGTLEQRLRENGISVTILDEYQLGGRRLIQELAAVIAEKKPDVVHTHRSKENIVGCIAAWQNGRIPSLQTLHGKYEHPAPFYLPHKNLKQFLDWLVARFYQAFVVAVSPSLANELHRYYPKRKIAMIENGIDIDAITAGGEHPGYHPTDAHNGSYHFAIAGRLSPVKRVDLFISCAVAVKQQTDKDVHFHIYGEGPLLQELQQQVIAAQAESFVHFEGQCDDLPAQLRKLDALLMTSDHEGLPMVLLEAMSLGTPIIGHAVGGIPNLLNQGESGTLVHEHTAQAFADAVCGLIVNPESSQRMAKQAKQRVRQLYSAEHMADSYLQLYKQLH